MRGPEGDDREQARRKIQRLGPVAVPRLVRSLGERDAARVDQAAETLLWLDREGAIDAIIDALRYAKGPPAKALRERLLGRPGRAVPALIAAIESLDSRGRTKLVAMLGQFEEDAAPGIPCLVRALRDRAPTVRSAAIIALGQIGEAALPQLPAMEEALGTLDRERNAGPYRVVESLRAGKGMPAPRRRNDAGRR